MPSQVTTSSSGIHYSSNPIVFGDLKFLEAVNGISSAVGPSGFFSPYGTERRRDINDLDALQTATQRLGGTPFPLKPQRTREASLRAAAAAEFAHLPAGKDGKRKWSEVRSFVEFVTQH